MKYVFSCNFGCAVCGVNAVGASVRTGRATVMLKGGAQASNGLLPNCLIRLFDVPYALGATAAAPYRFCLDCKKCPLTSEVLKQLSIKFTK